MKIEFIEHNSDLLIDIVDIGTVVKIRNHEGVYLKVKSDNCSFCKVVDLETMEIENITKLKVEILGKLVFTN